MQGAGTGSHGSTLNSLPCTSGIKGRGRTSQCPDANPFTTDEAVLREHGIDSAPRSHDGCAASDTQGSKFKHRVVFSHVLLWPFAIGRERDYLGDHELESILPRGRMGVVLSGQIRPTTVPYCLGVPSCSATRWIDGERTPTSALPPAVRAAHRQLLVETDRPPVRTCARLPVIEGTLPGCHVRRCRQCRSNR